MISSECEVGDVWSHQTTRTTAVRPVVSFVPSVLNATPTPAAALDPAPLFVVSAVSAPAAAPDILHVVPVPAAVLDPESFFVACAAAAPAALMFVDVLLPNTLRTVITRKLSADTTTDILEVNMLI